MNSSIRQSLEDVFREVFEDEDFEFSESLGRESLKAWDSLGHIRLIAAIEEKFDVRLTMEEIEHFSSVKDILARLA